MDALAKTLGVSRHTSVFHAGSLWATAVTKKANVKKNLRACVSVWSLPEFGFGKTFVSAEGAPSLAMTFMR